MVPTKWNLFFILGLTKVLSNLTYLTTNIKVICLESEAYKAWMKETMNFIKQENSILLDPWLTRDEAMKLLKIESRTRLQSIRDSGKIKVSKVEGSNKHILYERKSILEVIEAGIVSPENPQQ